MPPETEVDAGNPGDRIQTRIIEVDPRTLKLLEKNARHMPERQFKTLVANVKRDGALTSVPLVYSVDGALRVLSGNHRTKAAIAAGLPTIQVMEVVGTLSEARQVAIQLAQNALVGADDSNVLRELYDSLDILEKRYTGLTDTDLGLLDDPDFEKLAIGPPKYEEVLLSFLPTDRDEFERQFARIGELAQKKRIIHSRIDDYQTFFHTMLRTKDVKAITNDAVTLSVIMQLANERLDQIETEGEPPETTTDQTTKDAGTPAPLNERDTTANGRAQPEARKNPARKKAPTPAA